MKWDVLVVEGHDIGPAFGVSRQLWGDRPNPPLITVAVVKGLAHPDFLAEMDAIAVVPDQAIKREDGSGSGPPLYLPDSGGFGRHHARMDTD